MKSSFGLQGLKVHGWKALGWIVHFLIISWLECLGLKSFFGLCCKVILMDRLRADSWITMHSNLSIKTNLLWCWLLKLGVKKSRVEIWLHDSVCVFYLFPLSFVVFILFVAQFLAWRKFSKNTILVNTFYRHMPLLYVINISWFCCIWKSFFASFEWM